MMRKRKQQEKNLFFEGLRGKKISFDIDGVNADTAPLAVKLYNKRFNDNKKIFDLTQFYIVNNWINEKIRNEKKAIGESIKIWNDSVVLSKANPVSGAVCISRLFAESSFNIDVCYITSRPASTKNATYNWFKRWMPWVDAKNIFISDKENKIQDDFKSDKIKNLGIDIHFEDSWEHTKKIINVNPKTHVVVVRQPWNSRIKKSKADKNIIVAKKLHRRTKLFAAYEALTNHFNSNVAQY